MLPFQFNLNYESVPRFALVILGLTCIFYLAQVKHKQPSTWLFMGFLANLTLLFIFLFLSPMWSIMIEPGIVIFALFSLLFFMQFAYYFPIHSRPRESKIVLFGSSLGGLFMVGLGLYLMGLILQNPSFTVAMAQISLFMFLIIPLYIFFTVVVLLRQSLYWGGLPINSISQSVKMLFRPPTPEAKALRNFALALLIGFLPGFGEPLRRAGLISIVFETYLINLGLLLMTLVLFLVFLNHATERITFIVKLVSISLTALLVNFGFIGLITAQQLDFQAEAQRQADVVLAYQAILRQTFSDLPAPIVYIVSRPINEPTAYHRLFARQVDFDLLQYLVIQDKVRQEVPGRFAPAIAVSYVNEFAQVTALQVDTFRRYDDNFRVSKYSAYTFERDQQRYEVGLDDRSYQQITQNVIKGHLLLMIVSSLFIIIIFPLFFRTNLVTPLNALLDGVRQANQDVSAIEIPVRYQDEIGYLTQSFNFMIAEKQATILKLQQLDQAKSQFITVISHELRTPLNAINGFSELILQDLSGEAAESVKADVQRIHDNGQHLLELIDDILAISQIESGQISLNLEPIDSVEILEEVMAESNALLADKPIKILRQIPTAMPLVYADRARLKQILLNLLNNAIKFTSQGQISLKVTRLSDQQARFAVIDTGIGIPLAQQGEIFEKFKQVDMSDGRLYSGTGLGLAICRELVHLHGGQIGVQSDVGHGAEFWFTMSLAVNSGLFI